MDPNKIRLGSSTGGGGYNRQISGAKSYGGGRPMPTIGRVDPTGYRERDAKARAQRTAILSRLQSPLKRRLN